MTLVEFVNQFLSFLVVCSHIALLVAAVLWKKIPAWFRKKSILLAFIVATTSTLGSLFFSEVAQYDPCKLCWFQRIFMYPLTLLLGVALWKKDKGVRKYVMPMCVIGATIAAYHYVIYVSAKASSVCSVDTSCIIDYFTEFGYVNIPMMALTGFVLICVLMLLQK